MRFSSSAFLAIGIIVLMSVSGCADVKATQKVGDFGTAFGTTAEEQKAIDWFKTTYGDPTTNNNDPARFVEPLITTGLSDKNLPADKVTTFPVTGGSVYFFVIYDNFKKGDPITVSWVYLENGKEVTGVKQEAGGDFGRFIVEFQKPDSGWGKGKQRITVTGDGATANVDFSIGDALQTTPLPYNPASASGTIALSETPAISAVPTGGSGTKTGRELNMNGSAADSGSARLSNSPGMATIVTTPAAMVAAPQCKYGATSCNGICVHLENDIGNCGSCGNKCVEGVPNGRAHCDNGVCTVYVCDGSKPFRDCDKDVLNGCETDTSSDINNCGRCGSVCAANQECYRGKCCYHDQCTDEWNH